MVYLFVSTTCSTLHPAVVRDHTKALLRKQGTIFGDFIVTEFDDPLLQEHVISVSVSDIPRELAVRVPIYM